MWFPVDPRWPLSDTFQGHLDRVPPSTAPGIDIACPSGTPVLAPAPGTIQFSGWQSRGGRAVWVQHDGWRLYICHLNRVRRLKGERVRARDLLGFTGNTGASTGPHLHLSVRSQGQWHDPEVFFEQHRTAGASALVALDTHGDTQREVLLEVGREYVISPLNPEVQRYRGRRCELLAFVPRSDGTETVAKVRYVDTNRVGRAKLAHLAEIGG
jgi:murein DD-endopeptidase MepM/ murein hydrolase activator NlpD